MLTCGSTYFMETRQVAPMMFSVMLVTQISVPILEEAFKGGSQWVAWTVNGYFFPILTLDGYYWWKFNPREKKEILTASV